MKFFLSQLGFALFFDLEIPWCFLIKDTFLGRLLVACLLLALAGAWYWKLEPGQTRRVATAGRKEKHYHSQRGQFPPGRRFPAEIPTPGKQALVFCSWGKLNRQGKKTVSRRSF